MPIPYPVPVYPPSRSRSGLSYAYLDACMENCHLEEQLANSEERRHEERHRHRRELRAVKKRMREEGRVEGKAEGIKEGFDQVKMLEEVWNSGRQSKGTSLTTIYDAPQQQQQLLLPAPPPSYQNSEQLVGASLKAPSERSHYSSKPASAVTSSSHENMKRWLEVHPSSGRSELGQDPIVGSAQPSHSQATRPAPHLGSVIYHIPVKLYHLLMFIK